MTTRKPITLNGAQLTQLAATDALDVGAGLVVNGVTVVDASGNMSASRIASGLLPVARGGTGVGTISAFSARKTSNQTINSFNTGASWQKLLWQTKDFDIGSSFSTTNARHTPTIPGIYMYAYSFVYVADPSITSGRAFYASIFQNAAEATEKSVVSNGSANNVCMDGIAFLAMNGTSDYTELYSGHYDTTGRYIAANFTALFAGAWVAPLS